MFGILPSRLLLTGIGVVLVFAAVFHVKNKLQSLESEMFLQRDAKVMAETQVTQCNRNIELLNLEIENESILGALRQGERDQLLETINEERHQRASLAERIRNRARVSLADEDCAVTDLPADTSGLLNNAIATANYPAD